LCSYELKIVFWCSIIIHVYIRVARKCKYSNLGEGYFTLSISFQTSLSEHEASSIHLLLAFFMTVVENFKENVLKSHTTNAMVKEHVQNFEFFVIFGLFLKNCNIKTERKKWFPSF